jgi:hypothetical protein
MKIVVVVVADAVVVVDAVVQNRDCKVNVSAVILELFNQYSIHIYTYIDSILLFGTNELLRSLVKYQLIVTPVPTFCNMYY